MDVDFDQAKGSVGSLLLLFSRIERSAREELARMKKASPSKPAHGFAAIMNDWVAAIDTMPCELSLTVPLAVSLRAQLQGPIALRNAVCHGLNSISASHGDVPATLGWELNGERGSITWDELQTCFQWLSRVPHAISHISSGPTKKLDCRLKDSVENRAWWMAEYGILVST